MANVTPVLLKTEMYQSFQTRAQFNRIVMLIITG